MHQYIALIIFILAYTGFVVFPKRRDVTGMTASLLLVITGVISLPQAFQLVNWNVMGVFFGTLVVSELFLHSRMPNFLGEWIVNLAGSARGAVLLICLITGFISIGVENIATVLIIAPIAWSIIDKLKIPPIPVIIAIAISSNLQGAATLIGDPPSMLLAGYKKMNFNDFFFYEGKPSIFFAIEIGTAASFFVLVWIFRKYKSKMEKIPYTKIKYWTPTIILTLMILGLALSSLVDPDFVWLAGVLCMISAFISILWILWADKPFLKGIHKLLDWNSTFFLIGVFIIVGSLSEVGWIDRIAGGLGAIVGDSVLASYLIIIGLSLICSSFIDNVPFLLTMIPVADKLAAQLSINPMLLLFGLLIGACLGGNITPIGASANIVAMGLLRKRGYHVKFREFMEVGIPFTLVAVTAGAIFVWIVWR